MHNCECGNLEVANHVNAFVDLNGIPYLLSEYLDCNTFQQVDRSLIYSEIIVDQSDAMRAVVDISIDDIGKRHSDGYPAIVGNNTKHRNLLKMIADSCHMMNHQLNVFRRGIVIRVNYQLENYRTRQVIRSAVESFRITDRNYFLDINPRDTSDNGIIVNFCNTLVSTVNEFTHGQDPMMIRVTNIQMCYEMVKTSPHMPRIKQSLMGRADAGYLPTQPMSRDNQLYYHHQMMQNHHLLPGWDPNSYHPEDPNRIMPNTWSMFNRFYRFDNNGKDIILHDQEINNPMTQVALIPCGIVRVNRTFMINPGHRIIFKFSIWKNDVTVVHDASQVARALEAPIPYCDHHHHHMIPPHPLKHECDCHHHEPPHHPDHIIYPDYENMLNMLEESRNMEYQQNQVINQLTGKLEELTTLVQSLQPKEDDSTTTEPETPDTGGSTGGTTQTPDEIHDELQDQIDDLESDVDNLESKLEDFPNVLPIDSETIQNIVEANSQPEGL